MEVGVARPVDRVVATRAFGLAHGNGFQNGRAGGFQSALQCLAREEKRVRFLPVTGQVQMAVAALRHLDQHATARRKSRQKRFQNLLQRFRW